MKALSFLGGFLGLALVAAPAPAQVELRWKFQPGDTFTAQTDMNMRQTVSVLGMDQNMDMKMTTTVSFLVKGVSGEEVTLEQTYETTKFDMEGNPFASAMEDAMEKLKGLKVSFTFNPRTQEIIKVEGAKK